MIDKSDLPQVQLFSDGACLGNPGPGGWAYLLRHPASGRVKTASGAQPDTTNNRMEIMAVIKGLEGITRSSQVELIADSQYVLKGIKEWMPSWKAAGWRRGKNGREQVANVELWQRLDELLADHQVKVTWVRGHTGHPENETCDRLASEAANSILHDHPPAGREPEREDELFE